MWSLVSHAGAGVAIAGLSATYYALARKNYQVSSDLFAIKLLKTIHICKLKIIYRH